MRDFKPYKRRLDLRMWYHLSRSGTMLADISPRPWQPLSFPKRSSRPSGASGELVMLCGSTLQNGLKRPGKAAQTSMIS